MSHSESSMASQQQQPNDGHKSRRENQSVSSTSSSSRSARPAHPAVESAVTRLLVAIKQLLESLTMWSNLQLTETQISDVYVRLGNDFNAAVAAFASFDIDMRDLMSIPEDLRDVLETCLAEDATPDNLAIYLPKVRGIITRLLQGLRSKQSMYRRIVSEHHPSRHRSGSSSHSRTNSRSSRSDKTNRQDGESRGHRSQLSRTNANIDEERERHVERERENASGHVAARKSTRSSSHAPKPSEPQVQPQPRMTPPPVFQEPDDDLPTNDRTALSNGHLSQVPQPPSRNSQPAYVPSYTPHEQHVPADSSVPAPSTPRASSYPPTPEIEKDVPFVPPVQAAPVPPTVKRYSLVDKPISSPPRSPPTVVIEEPSPDRNETNGVDASPPQTPPIEPADVPAVASSLAALKKSEALERRASKRFSTYHFSKMTGGVITRERSLPSPNNRRSMAASSTLTAGDLAVLTESEEPEGKRDGAAKRIPRTPSPSEVAPPVPPLPSSVSDVARQAPPARTPTQLSRLSEVSEEVEPEEASQSTAFPVFLQVGREVKKVTLEPGLTFSSLRVLFVDKFSYNPGMENFPAIYIRDLSSGVQYELEDIDEVREKCLLSLNIEPLDQIKQHIDAQISTLSNDLKELKNAMSNNRRSSFHLNPIYAHDFAESTPVAADRPTEKQFANVAHRLSRIVGDAHGQSNPFIFPQGTGQSLQLQPQATGASVMSEYSSRVVDDLKTQFDEVQNLRRDLGIMRQLYTEFMKSTKESLGALRTQTQSVKQLASAKVGGARAYIDTGKTKLDTRSQNVLTKIEELQDTIEALKEDVIKRHVTPKPTVLKTIHDDISSTSAELSSLKEHIDTIRPMWKKTWEEELQNIVEEQGFLGHQEELLADLLEDHKALTEVFGHVQKVISLRGTGSGRGSARGRAFKPPPADEGHAGLSTVMMEIRGAAVDPEKRMKAIAANQKHRERELANRSDAFQNELSGFVNGKKLKMTGGAEEAERVRQKRNDLALKAMFNASGGEGRPVSPTA